MLISSLDWFEGKHLLAFLQFQDGHETISTVLITYLFVKMALIIITIAFGFKSSS